MDFMRDCEFNILFLFILFNQETNTPTTVREDKTTHSADFLYIIFLASIK